MTHRVKALVAVLLVGDGVVAALQPKRHLRRWDVGPQAWRRVTRAFRARPRATRILALAQAVAGAWWALRLVGRAR
ncbi:MAG: hypothetical protein ICV64_10915 [Thermoleophilia bacterium]|nr:hypothetical protein [Thermoleophilia bacterium]